MADKQRDLGKEPLTEREQEAIQLARAIARVAGLELNPEDATEKRREILIDSTREYYARMAEFFKHISTLSAAAIVGIVAVFRALAINPSRIVLFIIVLGLLLLAYSLCCSAYFFYFVSHRERRIFVARQSLESKENLAELQSKLEGTAHLIDWVAFSIVICWVLGLVVCAIAFLYHVISINMF